MPGCDRKDCPNEATGKIVLELRPEFYPGAPIRMVTPLVACDDCRSYLNIENVMDDEGWEMICQAVKLAGKARPTRAKTVLTYWPLDS